MIVECPKCGCDNCRATDSTNEKDKPMGMYYQCSCCHHYFYKGLKNSDEVTYEKCCNCTHSQTYYQLNGGCVIVCKITGKSITLTECPVSD